MGGGSRSVLGTAVPVVAIVALLVAVSLFVMFQLQSKNETSPFRINSDAEMGSSASRMGWPGNGSINNPFIIDGLSMKTESSTPCVYIGNTSYHFVLSHCTMTGPSVSEQYDQLFVGYGIELFNLRNGTIRGNALINCSIGISLKRCSACDLINNSVLEYGEGWRVDRIAIRLDNSSQNTIRGNDVVGHFVGSDSDQNQVIDNQFTGYRDGIHLLRCNSTHLDNNSIWAKELPIHIMDCSGCLVLNNSIESIGQTSLFEAVENMRFEKNTLKTIGGVTMELRTSHNNYLINNKFQGSLILLASSDNLIEKNQLGSSIGGYKISISGGGSNEVQGNRIWGRGIELIDTETNQIVGNEIQAEGYGIVLTNATNNTCISNMLLGCQVYGSQDLAQAWDDTGSNRWNDSTGGNYWSDWVGASALQPYLIDGGAGAADYRPLSDPPPSPPPDEKVLSSIRIDNNSEMVSMASKWGWPGGGSLGIPYVIDGLTLYASNESPCIYIGNTSLHFTISNCSLYGVPVDSDPIGNGIEFSNLNNATVRGCYVYDCRLGVILHHCSSILLINNTITADPWMSISVESSNNCTLINNQLIGASSILDSFGITFERNDFPNSYFSGLSITGGGSNNILENNITNFLANSVVVDNSDLNVIMRNEIRGSGYAILVKGSNNNTIISNNIQGTHTSTPGPDVQAFDDTGRNRWNDSQGGNFWRGWSGSQTGQPYPIDGGAEAADLRPLSSPLVI